MGSIILLRTIGGVDDKRVVLQNSNWARPFTIDSGWTKLRIAFRVSITDSGASVGSTPRFAIGLCSGSTNIFMDATTTHFVGVVSDAGTWSRRTSPTGYGTGTGQIKPATRIGTTLTLGSGFSSSCFEFVDAALANRTALFVDITKGSPNYTFQVFSRTNATSGGDVDKATFDAQAETAVPTITNHTLFGSGTLAVNEGTNGTLNHVCAAWDRSTPQIELSDDRIVKLA